MALSSSELLGFAIGTLLFFPDITLRILLSFLMMERICGRVGRRIGSQDSERFTTLQKMGGYCKVQGREGWRGRRERRRGGVGGGGEKDEEERRQREEEEEEEEE